MSYSNSLKCVCWNIDGLASKLSDDDFIPYMHPIDIVCLIETFLDDTFHLTNHFCNYVKYLSPAIKHSNMGRRSGGLLVLVKKRLETFVSKIELSAEQILALKISKELIHSDQAVVVVVVYIPPQGDSNCHVAALDSCLLDIWEGFPEAHIV